MSRAFPTGSLCAGFNMSGEPVMIGSSSRSRRSKCRRRAHGPCSTGRQRQAAWPPSLGLKRDSAWIPPPAESRFRVAVRQWHWTSQNRNSGPPRRSCGSCLCAGRSGKLEVPACQVRSLLGGRSTVGHRALDAVIGVRIPASQPLQSLRSFVAARPRSSGARRPAWGASSVGTNPCLHAITNRPCFQPLQHRVISPSNSGAAILLR